MKEFEQCNDSFKQDTEDTEEQKRAKKKRNYSQTFNITKEFHKTGNFETVQTYQKGGGTFSLLKFEPLAKLKPTTSNIRIVPKSLERGSMVRTPPQEASPTSSCSSTSQEPTTPQPVFTKLDGSNEMVISKNTRNAQQVPSSPTPFMDASNQLQQKYQNRILNLQGSQLNQNVNYFIPNQYERKYGISSSAFTAQLSKPPIYVQNTGSTNVSSNTLMHVYSSATSPPVYASTPPMYISNSSVHSHPPQQFLSPTSNTIQKSMESLSTTEPAVTATNSSAFKPVQPKKSSHSPLQSDHGTKRRKMDLEFILNKE